MLKSVWFVESLSVSLVMHKGFKRFFDGSQGLWRIFRGSWGRKGFRGHCGPGSYGSSRNQKGSEDVLDVFKRA